MTPRFSVADFVAVTNQALETAFGVVEVEGEVASFKVNQQKFVFFDLKDSEATVNCFMSVWQLRLPIEDGMRVVVRAVPKLTAWGRFSLTVQEVKPLGEGQLKRSADLLRQKLDKEGLFAPERKRPLPAYPRRVGVVSSIQAAGYADFVKIAGERWGGVGFIVAHTQVQGDGAADQMIRAIAKLEQLPEPPEVIVLIRGGGSADDLAAFQDEALVRAVAASRVPVLTGIGHEIDETLCDLAADVRAATPSNAAQLLFPDKHEVVRRLQTMVSTVGLAYERRIDETRAAVRQAAERAHMAWLAQVERRLTALRGVQSTLTAYDPELVLRRGYAMIDGAVEPGSVVTITTESLIATATITNVTARRGVEKGEQ
ncbi:MAG: exodeoxyribonuclease VII large subunit [Candidatus Saccharibacteria bacterium]|nr:exodeoxyribonuclease VII large subunit [Candidatus Saccharibacteria bacterium]